MFIWIRFKSDRNWVIRKLVSINTVQRAGLMNHGPWALINLINHYLIISEYVHTSSEGNLRSWLRRRFISHAANLIPWRQISTNRRTEQSQVRSVLLQETLLTVVRAPALGPGLPHHLHHLLLLLAVVLEMLPQTAGVGVHLLAVWNLTFVRFLKKIEISDNFLR